LGLNTRLDDTLKKQEEEVEQKEEESRPEIKNKTWNVNKQKAKGTKKLNEKADVFSFGIICVEVLTRELPLKNISSEEFYSKTHEFAIQLIDSIPKNAPEFLIEIIRKSLSIDPLDRPNFQSICSLFQ